MPHNEKNQSLKVDPEITHMVEFVDEDIEKVTLTIFHMFKKVEERLNLLRT